MATKAKTKTIKLDPDQATLEAEAAHDWLHPRARAAVWLLRAWVEQTQIAPEGLRPPEWPEIQDALAELQPVSALAKELAAAKRAATAKEKATKNAWVESGGSLADWVQARAELATIQDIHMRTVWRSHPEVGYGPLKTIGDRLITEWLQPQVQHYWELIQETFPAGLAAKLTFGMLTPIEVGFNMQTLDAFPQVRDWFEQIRELQGRAETLRDAGIVSVAAKVEGMDNRLQRVQTRYNWDAGVLNMTTRFGTVIDEDDLAQWLGAAIVHGKGPTILTGEQVDARKDEPLRRATGADEAEATQNAWTPAKAGTTIVSTAEKPLFYRH